MFALKTDLHLHSKEDPYDCDSISYSAKELIDYMAQKKFDIIGLTLHDHILDKKKLLSLKKYAKKKGILLIPGVEKTIEKAHVLLYGLQQEDLGGIKELTDLKKIRKKYGDEILIGAPHPFFPTSMCIGRKYYNCEKDFDFLEWNSFYTKEINFNKKVIMEKKRMIGNSDAHSLERIGYTYTFIHTNTYKNKYEFKEHVRESNDKTYDLMIQDIIRMLKDKQTITELVSKPLPYSIIMRTLSNTGIGQIKKITTRR